MPQTYQFVKSIKRKIIEERKERQGAGHENRAGQKCPDRLNIGIK